MQATLLASLAPSEALAYAKYLDMPNSGVTDPAHLGFMPIVRLERGACEAQGYRESGVPHLHSTSLHSCALHNLSLELTERNWSLLNAGTNACIRTSCFHICDLILTP